MTKILDFTKEINIEEMKEAAKLFALCVKLVSVSKLIGK